MSQLLFQEPASVTWLTLKVPQTRDNDYMEAFLSELQI